MRISRVALLAFLALVGTKLANYSAMVLPTTPVDCYSQIMTYAHKPFNKPLSDCVVIRHNSYTASSYIENDAHAFYSD